MQRRFPALWLCALAIACGGDDGDDDAADGVDTDASASASMSTTADDDGPSSTTPGTDATTTPSTSDPGTTSDDTDPGTGTDPDSTGDTGPLELPPPDGGLDYQLGGAYPPPEGVTIVSRDRNEAPEPGIYNICYVNGYQAQPDEADWWLSEHPDLVLRDGNGDPVIDPDWDEMLLDISTPEKREALAVIVGEWIAGCGADGYDAVEIDNLDTYSRSMGLLTQDHAVAFMVLLSEAAHGAGMAIAQKNSTELVPRKAEMGTDFVVAEECNTYSECGDYIDAYGDAVLMIEYVPNDFETGCADWPGYSIVLRDLDLVTPSDGAYVYDAC